MIRLATANLRNSLRYHSQRQDVLFPLPSWISWFASVCTWTHDSMWGINYKVFPMGLEPMTPSLKGMCSTNWATRTNWGLHDTSQQRPLIYHLLLATPVVDSMGLEPMNIMLCQSMLPFNSAHSTMLSILLAQELDTCSLNWVVWTWHL